MIPDYHLSAINRCRLRRSPPIWCMVVAMVGQNVPVTYWWSCVAYSGLLKVAKSVTGSFFSRLGHLNPGSKSARTWVRSTSCRNQIQIVNFFDPCDLEIWRMTLKNNRAPLLCYFKLCSSFYSHWWFQTGFTIQKRSIPVKINFFVTLKNDKWPWKTIGHLTFDLWP